MKGIIRAIDELGRITPPIEIRRDLNYEDKQGLSLSVINKTIHLKKGSGRKLDSLGRYTLPIEIRRGLELGYKEFVDMWVEDEEICIRKASLQCVICGEEADERKLIDVDDVLICRKCGDKVVDKFMEEEL